MRRLMFLSLFVLISIPLAHAEEGGDARSAVVLDENMWVTFYDLPSRRFRAIRSAVIGRDSEAAARDLNIAANYLSVESTRASVTFKAPLEDVVARLRAMSENPGDVTLDSLDNLFGRAHWLLAQHYLELARTARDSRENRNTSLYLWATTHHMERAVLWSNVPVTRRVQSTLQDLRDIASRLRDPETAERAFKQRPVVRAERLLRDIGVQIERRVVLPAAPTPPASMQSD